MKAYKFNCESVGPTGKIYSFKKIIEAETKLEASDKLFRMGFDFYVCPHAGVVWQKIKK